MGLPIKTAKYYVNANEYNNCYVKTSKDAVFMNDDETETLGNFQSSITTQISKKANQSDLDSLFKYSSVLVIPSDNFRISEISSSNDKVIKLIGTNDDAAINSLIDNVGDKPLKIGMLEGNIYCNDKIKIYSYTTMLGSGQGTKINVKNNAEITQKKTDNNLLGCTFENFQIIGDREINSSTKVQGIKISAQECKFRNLTIRNCYLGMNVEAGYGVSVMNHIDSCNFLDNCKQGLRLGTDSLLTHCMFGQNAMYERDSLDYDSCGLLITGYGNQILGNHLYKNKVNIRSDWASFSTIQNNLFEAGYEEDIVLVGRAWCNTISSNRFSGKDTNGNYSNFGCIKYDSISSTELAYNNMISFNNFAFDATRPNAKYKNIIQESSNCDNNMYTNNMFRLNYTDTEPIIATGSNSLISNNFN